jgi:NAD(P)-dependent dehydrogenase (short-subunit alcohol dehydrogenase family)
MPSLSAARTFNSALTFPYRPVGVFVGGTSGIGEGLVRAFAQHTKGDVDIIIVGRNRQAGEAILSSLPTPPPPADPPRREFVHCDASLTRNVQATTDELSKRLPSLNYLVITAGIFNLKGRDETEEGIDRQLALHYYSRWKFIHKYASLILFILLWIERSSASSPSYRRQRMRAKTPRRCPCSLQALLPPST